MPDIVKVPYSELFQRAASIRQQADAVRREVVSLSETIGGIEWMGSRAERFFRMWEFYLAGSEIAFRWDELFVFQMQITRQQFATPDNRNYIQEREAVLKQFEATRPPLEKVAF